MEKIIIHIHGDVHIHLDCDTCEDFFEESDCMEKEFESKDEHADAEPAMVFCAFDDASEPTLEENVRKTIEAAAMLLHLNEPEKKDHRKGAGHEGI